MFDIENPFKDLAEDIDETTEEFSDFSAEEDLEDAEWEGICNNPHHQAEGAKRAARAAVMESLCDTMEAKRKKDREELFDNFYEKEYWRRRERTLIKAMRYGVLAFGCGVITYVCYNHGISWLAWLLGSAGVIFSIVSGYGFGIAREMSR